MEAARPNVVSPKNVRACAHRHADVVLDLSLDVRGDIRGRAPSGCFLSLLLLLFSRKKIAPWVVAGPFCRGGVCALFPPVAAVGKKEGAQEKKKEGTTQEGDPKRQTKKRGRQYPFSPSRTRAWSLVRVCPLLVARATLVASLGRPSTAASWAVAPLGRGPNVQARTWPTAQTTQTHATRESKARRLAMPHA